MRGRRIFKFVGFFMIGLAIAALFGVAVLYLWNWLMPSLFGLHSITYAQAWGLLILSWILFRGPRGWGGGGPHRWNRTRGRWQRMTPEEREKFRARLRECFQDAEPKPAEGKS